MSLAVISMTSAARAADQGDAAIDGGVVEVAAESSVPGVSGVEVGVVVDDCEWVVVISDDLAQWVYNDRGVRMFSATGRWFERRCDGAPVVVNGQFVVPEGDGFAEPDLLQQAFDQLDPPAPAWSASPDGTAVPMVTQLETILWVDPAYWSADFGVRVVTPNGRAWAEAHAVPTVATWSTGDGATVSCGPGTPYEPDADERAATEPCTHMYTQSTTSGGYPLGVAVSFDAVGSTSTGAGPVALGTLVRAAAPVAVSVIEIQAVES